MTARALTVALALVCCGCAPKEREPRRITLYRVGDSTFFYVVGTDTTRTFGMGEIVDDGDSVLVPLPDSLGPKRVYMPFTLRPERRK